MPVKKSKVSGERMLPKAQSLSPVRLGNCVLIRTVTCYQVGRIVSLSKEEIVLEDASWVADTGRYNAALRSGTLAEVEPFIGNVSVSRGAVVDVVSWNNPLPRDVK
jgi:hypothetical protein